MRVLVIANNFPTPALPLDGAYVMHQVQALRRLGHEFLVLRALPYVPRFYGRWAYFRNVPDAYDVEGVPVRVMRTVSAPSELLMATYAGQLRARVDREIGRFRAELIHAHGTLPSGSIAARHRIPVVLTGHGTDSYATPFRRPDLGAAARRALHTVDICAAVSEFVANRMRMLVPERNVRVIPNGADESIFRPLDRQTARRRLNLPAETAVVSFVGRLDVRKGLVDLVDAAAELSQRPLLVLAGEGIGRATIAEHAAKRGVTMRFLGAVAPSELPYVYACADAVALPSYAEGLPTVLCEAMLSGSAVVASNVGGIPEIVHSGTTGLLHEPHDVAGLRLALQSVLSDPELRDALAKGARSYALDRLTWAANARQYDQIYREGASPSRRS